jgi:ribosomal protein L3 glutamine methyltransferase
MKRLTTLGDWLDHAVRLYGRNGVVCGQVSPDPRDEALYLLLHALGFPLDSDEAVLGKKLTASERDAVRTILRRRVKDRVPAAYLTGEAWLGGLRFLVDERVLIPRSYFVEVIPGLERAQAGNPPGRPQPRRAVTRIADVGTGSGCLAILLARRFPKAAVDAIDVSPGALEVAAANVRAHRLSRRVALHRSDVFDAVPPAKYDLIVSNPPYEPTSLCRRLPEEFRREPALALDGGKDGLAIIRKLVAQAAGRLRPGGLLLIEVGGLRRAIDREFAALKPEWLPTADGSDCICRFRMG